LANVLDEGLRIEGRGRRMNSKVRLNLNLSLAGLSWPLYIGGQVSRIRLGSIQITVSVYEMISYYDWAYLNGPQGYKDNGLY
jgi:hypothetical protein